MLPDSPPLLYYCWTAARRGALPDGSAPVNNVVRASHALTSRGQVHIPIVGSCSDSAEPYNASEVTCKRHESHVPSQARGMPPHEYQRGPANDGADWQVHLTVMRPV
jgi:hypothetical protein